MPRSRLAARLWSRLAFLTFAGLLWCALGPARAARLAGVAILDKDYLSVDFEDGEVIHNESGTEKVNRFTPVLDTAAAALPANWTVGRRPTAPTGPPVATPPPARARPR